jgi:hypothetical protein
MVDYYVDMVPKHRKRKKKKTPKKSDHKHLYKDVLIKRTTSSGEDYYSATQCTICGKIGKERWLEMVKSDSGAGYRSLNNEELLEKYKECKIIDKTKEVKGE